MCFGKVGFILPIKVYGVVEQLGQAMLMGKNVSDFNKTSR